MLIIQCKQYTGKRQEMVLVQIPLLTLTAPSDFGWTSSSFNNVSSVEHEGLACPGGSFTVGLLRYSNSKLLYPFPR